MQDGTGPGPSRLSRRIAGQVHGLVSDQRYRRAFRSSALAIANSGTTIVISLITVPLLLSHLGAERFGLWMTILSFVAIQGMLDLGIGNGLVSMLARATGLNDTALGRRLVSSALVITLVASAVIGIVFYAAFPLIRWDIVFNITDPALAAESGTAVALLAIAFMLAIPASIARRAQAGLQSEYIASLWEVGARWIGFAGLILGIAWGAGIPWVLAMIVGMPVLGAVCNAVVFFGRTHGWLRPSLAHVHRQDTSTLMRAGFLFFVLQSVATLTFASDNFIITQVLGPEAVVGYAILRTLFQFVAIPVGLLCSPLWPAYGEALASGDIAWAKRTLARSIALSLALTIGGSLILILFGDGLLQLWLGRTLDVPPALWWGFAAFTVAASVGNAVSMMMNAAIIIRFQVIVAITLCVFAVPLKVLAAEQFGVAGVSWAVVLSYTAIALLPMLIYIRRWLRRLPYQHANGVQAGPMGH